MDRIYNLKLDRGQWVNTVKPVRQNDAKRLTSTDGIKQIGPPKPEIQYYMNDLGISLDNKKLQQGSSIGPVNLQLGQRQLATKHKEDVTKQNEILINLMMPPLSRHSKHDVDPGPHEYSESYKNEQLEREKRARQAKAELENFFSGDFLDESDEELTKPITQQPRTRNATQKVSKTKENTYPTPLLQNLNRINSCSQYSTNKAPQMICSSMADFKINRTLGSGAFATVKLATHEQTNKKVALKIYHNLQGIQLKAVDSEILCMKKLHSDFFPRLYGDFETLSDIVLVQEYIQGQSLLKIIQKKGSKGMKEAEALQICKGLAKALMFMHGKNICHRDLKMDNIIIADRNGQPKIIDFGFSIESGDQQKLKITCGTTLYMAPELLSQQSYSGFAVDVWALGVIFYIILTGQAPFKHKNESELKSRIVQGSFIFPTTVGYEPQRLIKKMMSLNPKLRPTAQEICHDQWL